MCSSSRRSAAFLRDAGREIQGESEVSPDADRANQLLGNRGAECVPDAPALQSKCPAGYNLAV